MHILSRPLIHNLTTNNSRYFRKILPYDLSESIQHNNVSNQRNTKTTKIEIKRNFADNVDKKKQNLLRYPALSLEETIKRFLLSVEPVVDETELEETKEAAEKFLKTDGAHLQELLEKAAEEEVNWLGHRWMRYAYLQQRDQVTVFSSPGQTLPIREFENDEVYCDYVGRAISCMLQFKITVDQNELPVAKMGENELDNSQFGLVLGTCRIPQKDVDCIEYHPDSKHIVIIYKNHFYKLPVYNKAGSTPMCAEYISKQITEIMKFEKRRGKPFGILTSENRDNWAAAYEELLKEKQNADSLREIQTALFIVALDEDVPIAEGQEWNVHAQQLITGGGSMFNSANRFMDKTIQLVCNRNGMCGFVYEHTPAEGQPVAIMTDYIIENLDKIKEFGSCDPSEPFSKLEFKSNEIINKAISKAECHVDKLACNLQMNILRYDKYGKGFCKAQKLSPDSYIQMALQVAFYRLHGRIPAQYESAHLRIFDGGRTETIRSCCIESATLAKAMASDSATVEDKANVLRAAIEGHRKLTNAALSGNGIDRHLLGLKLMAIENNKPVPEYFYNSPGYVKSMYWSIATSQVASKHPIYMCYGAVVPDGYACCYNPRNNEMILALSDYRADKFTDLSAFSSALTDTLDDMGEILCRTSRPKAKL